MKTLRKLLIKKKSIENWKKALEWCIVNEVMMRNLIEEGKKTGINEVIKRNEVINKGLKW